MLKIQKVVRPKPYQPDRQSRPWSDCITMSIKGDLAALAYKDVIREPVVRKGNTEVPALVADLGIKGVWLPQTEALLDIRVTWRWCTILFDLFCW